MYFTSRNIVAIAACSAFWAILNTTISPIFWQVTRMPFLCDLLGFISLSLVIWWTRKPGSASLTGLIVSGLTLIMRPGAFHMLGFIVASILFDFLTMGVGYKKIFERPNMGYLVLVLISVACAWVAGLIIGSFFMGFTTTYAILLFSGLHAVGGLLGGIVGVFIVRALSMRRIQTMTAETQ
ncbi:MAG: hypothetical protein ACUVTM_01940 [Candidatus Bathyarchaeia archaeon]